VASLRSGLKRPQPRPGQATILITAAGSSPAQAFIRGLRAQSEVPVRLVGVDTTAHSAGLFDCDRRYTVPRVDDQQFLEAIETICREESVDVLAPIGNFELQLFADAAAVLRRDGVRVISNSPETVAIALDKRASAAAVGRHGVAVPTIYDAGRLEEVGMPVIVKPTTGAGSHGVTAVRHGSDLAAALALAGEHPLIQDFIEGQEYTVDLVVAPDGEILAVAPRIRVEVRAGQSYKGVTADDADIEEAARRCAAALGITAQANVQLIKSAVDGRCHFVEVNPKFAAAMGLTIGAGLNIPLLYVKLALGLPIREAELRRAPRVWLLRSWNDRVVSESVIQAVPSWDCRPDAGHRDQRTGPHGGAGAGAPRLR
jgi:carbamoyl-phosphate synthase large subunit